MPIFEKDKCYADFIERLADECDSVYLLEDFFINEAITGYPNIPRREAIMKLIQERHNIPCKENKQKWH